MSASCTSQELARIRALDAGGGGGAGDGGGIPGLGDGGSASCGTLPATTLDELWVKYLSASPSSGKGGCAQATCHRDGAGSLSFTNPLELFDATVGKPSLASPGAALVVPGNPAASYLYFRLTSAAGTRQMPEYGPYLEAAQLAEVAGWICNGAPAPSSNDFGVPVLPPTITSFSPATGGVADVVTITGTQFSTLAAEDQVAFNGAAATLSAAPSATTIQALVPVGATTGKITVTTPGGMASSASDFVVVPKPVITSLSASQSGTCGVLATNQSFTLTINGSGFVPGSTVSVTDAVGKSYPATAPSVSATTITVNLMIPVAPADRYVQVVVSTPPPSPLSSAPAILGVASTAVALTSLVGGVFKSDCASSGCHDGGMTLPGSLDLSTTTTARAGLVGVASELCQPIARVRPCDPRRAASFMIDKILSKAADRACNGATGVAGTPMPPKGGLGLTIMQKQLLQDWVAQGAP